MNRNKGTLYWFTGLPGAGKTTLSKKFNNWLESKNQQAILLDGDSLREILGDQFGYEPEQRKALALSYAKLSKNLTEQGFDVVFATVSMFAEVRKWNRHNIAHYIEVYVEVSDEILRQRNQKNIYSLKGDEKGSMPFSESAYQLPENPDIKVKNEGDLEQVFTSLIQQYEKLGSKK